MYNFLKPFYDRLYTTLLTVSIFEMSFVANPIDAVNPSEIQSSSFTPSHPKKKHHIISCKSVFRALYDRPPHAKHYIKCTVKVKVRGLT